MKKAVCPYLHLILPHSTKNTHNRQNKHPLILPTIGFTIKATASQICSDIPRRSYLTKGEL